MPDSNADLSVLSSTPATAGPQVPPPKLRWKTRLLLPGVLLSAFAAVLLYSMWDVLWPAPEVRTVPVICQSGREGGGGVACQAAGWVEADPYTVHVSALTDGIVKEVLVLEGQRVNAGDVVVRLVDDDARLALAQAEAEVARKQAGVLSARAVLEAAQKDWDHPVSRKQAEAVAGSALAETKAQLVQAEKEIAVALARVAELTEQYRRESASAASQAIPEFQAVRTGLQLKIEEARHESAHAQRAVLEAQLGRMQADLTAAQQNAQLRIPERRALADATAQLALAEAEVKLAQAARDAAQLRLDRTQVRTPAAGVVMTRSVSPGSKLMMLADYPQSTQAVHLYDPEKLQVRADVPLTDAAKVSVGQAAKIVVEVLPDRTFDGVVTRVVHEADLQKNTLQVKVAIQKPAQELKPEMLARIQFLAPAKAAGDSDSGYRVFAPQRLLQPLGNGQAQTWIVDKGRSAALHRSVQTGPTRLNDWIEVVSGLQPGDALIDNPPPGLKEGQKVRLVGEVPATGEQHAGSVRP